MRAPNGKTLSYIGIALLAIVVTAGALAIYPFLKERLRYANTKRSNDGLEVTKAIPKKKKLPDYPVLTISKLQISVPIIENVDTSLQRIYNTALKGGVAHMKGTPDLESKTGNTAIIGHSSRFTPSGTPYDAIFANIDKLKEGDVLLVETPKSRHTYTITQSKSTSADDLDVIANHNRREITLITCWPVGTPLKRWAVHAQLSN